MHANCLLPDGLGETPKVRTHHLGRNEPPCPGEWLANNDSTNTFSTETQNLVAPRVSTGEQNAVTLTTGTTTFQDDGHVLTQSVRLPTAYDGLAAHDSSAIADFLAKPKLVHSGTWSNAQAFETLLYTGSVSNLLASEPFWINKMQGYKLVRGTAVFKLVLNANPFQQGKMIMSFQPCYRHLSTTQQASINTMMAQITTAPNVEIDATESSVELRVPYVTPLSWYDRLSQDYDWGTVFLHVLSPLATGATGSNSADYALYLSFENFETTAPFSAQSGKPVTVRSVVRKEKERSAKGVVSGSLDLLSRATGSMSDMFSNIPGISYVGKFSAAAAKAGEIAQIFGFSKPNASPPITDVVSFPFRYLANYTGQNSAPTLAYSHDQQIVNHDGIFGHDLDEMSFAYLKTIPALASVFNWSTSNVEGTGLMSTNISPATCMSSKTNTITGSTLVYRAGSPLFMLHRLFGAYRGGVIVTIKFAKTKMHSGRIQVVFECFPGSFPSIANSMLTLREIVDIRETDSVTLHLPYMFGENYLNLITDGTEATHDNIDAIGALSIRVLSELKAPDSVSSTIQGLVYYQPDCDFEYAGVGTGNLAPFYPQGGYEPQSGVYDQGHLLTKGIGDSNCTDQGLTPNAMSFGDPLVSVKQLLNCARPVTFNWSGFNQNNVYMWPFGSTLYTNSGVPANPVLEPTQAFGGGFYSMIKSGYAFEKGGVRITNTNNLSNSTRAYLVPLSASFLSNMIGTPPTESAVTAEYYNVFPYTPSTSQRATLDVNVPGWQRANFRLNKFATPSDLSAPSVNNSCDAPYALSVYQDSALPTRGWVRSFCDDYRLGYFKGFAPYCLPRPT